jgi:hypothetical protein
MTPSILGWMSIKQRSVAVLDSSGKLVMEAILEIKAETILQLLAATGVGFEHISVAIGCTSLALPTRQAQILIPQIQSVTAARRAGISEHRVGVSTEVSGKANRELDESRSNRVERRITFV